MALPLLWIGAAAVSALAVKELADDRKEQQRQRRSSFKPQSLDDLGRHNSPVAVYPSDLFDTHQTSAPAIGAVVCCGIGGVLEHTGIWVGEDTIIELDGQGLIKPISVKRFTKERSGSKIFIACDSLGNPLASELAAERAVKQIFQYQDYHLLENNCHQFIWQCFKPNDESLTTFKSLNRRIAKHFNRKIFWDICDASSMQTDPTQTKRKLKSFKRR